MLRGNRGYAEVPLSTVIPRAGNAHLQKNRIPDFFLEQYHRKITFHFKEEFRQSNRTEAHFCSLPW